MRYITIIDNIITNIVQSDKQIFEVKPLFPEADRIIEINKTIPAQKGMNINLFNEDWTLKSLTQLVEEGLKEIPEGYELKDNEFVKIPDEPEPEKTQAELLKEKIEEAIQTLSMNCNEKRIEIIDDKRIMNVLTGATIGYPEFMTIENIGKVIELFKNIYHTYYPQIKTAKTIEEVEEIMNGIVYPDLNYITSKMKQEA